MSRPLQARIDLKAITSNYRYGKQLSPGAVVAVVKADAYGHGLEAVGRHLATEVDAMAVATIEEALVLRAAGVSGRVLVLEGVFDRDAMEAARDARLDLVVHSDYQLRILNQCSLAAPDPGVNIWLKIDTGMGRLGFECERAADVYRLLQSMTVVRSIVLMTHMACADDPGNQYNALQIDRFDYAYGAISKAACFRSGVAKSEGASIANSAALLALRRSRRQWDRAGIMLFGVNPIEATAECNAPLSCSMTLTSRLIAVRSVTEGTSIGYGTDFRFARDGCYGIVACGYGDGYPRHAGTGTPVAVAGKRTRIIGRVSMDMLAVDLTGFGNISPGAPVELWGEQVSVSEVASSAGTIAYELFTGLTGRVPRVYAPGKSLNPSSKHVKLITGTQSLADATA